MTSKKPDRKIPKTMEPFFQEYDFDSLNLQSDRELIIGRTLEFGTKKVLTWLFKTYSTQEIIKFVQKRGYRALSARSFNYWCVVLEIKQYSKPSWLKDKKVLWKF
jgi:hypothetical protein